MNFENWRALASSHEKPGDITMHYSGCIDVCVRQVEDKPLLRFSALAEWWGLGTAWRFFP